VDHPPLTISSIQPFLDQVLSWATEHVDIQSVALVGSYACGRATPSSDIDLVLLVDEPGFYLADTSWIGQFGSPLRQQAEDYGKVTSLRVWYRDGPEVEFGLTMPDWAAQPLDAGTDQVLMEGVKVLYERRPLISPVLGGFSQAEEIYARLARAIRQRANPEMAAKSQRWYKNADFRSYGLTRTDHREIYRTYRREILALPLRGRLHLARWLVVSGYAEQANFANTALALSVKELGPADFAYLDEHLNHFHGWGQTDDFCINIFQPLLWKYPEQTLRLLQDWNRSENPWKRRASVVVFVRKVGASGKFTSQALALCENLLWDKEDLVQKGVGWALKDVMRGDRERVFEYVKALRRRGIPATITLYAIRDLKGAERQAVLEIHAIE
jgi:3-methyladenine DNA glycosylase AlkD